MSDEKSDPLNQSKEHKSSYIAIPSLDCSNHESKDESPRSEIEESNYDTNDAQIASLLQVQIPEKTPDDEEAIKHIPTVNKIPWQIYLSRVLSAWGDRIWDFALGIFMNLICPESLRLAAIQGFLINISVILFGSAVGNWIDKNKRLFAAKVFLIVQNVAVAVACCALALHFYGVRYQVKML